MMQENFLLSLALAAAALAPAQAALSQGPTPSPRLVLQALDTDHDGSLSAAELTAAPHALLALDRNGDGQITFDELQPRPENAGASADDLAKQLLSFDKNGDGVLTPAELPARMQSLFQRGDTDHDAKLTRDEIRALAAHQGMPAGMRAQPGRANGMMRTDPLLNALDTDHDGTLSASEIAIASKALAALDVNGDGSIAADEMRVRQQTPAERADHLLDEWDTNKDGKIAKAEAPDRLQQQFDSIDKNTDGVLDKGELVQYFATAGAAQRGASRPPATSGDPAGPKEQKQ